MKNNKISFIIFIAILMSLLVLYCVESNKTTVPDTQTGTATGSGTASGSGTGTATGASTVDVHIYTGPLSGSAPLLNTDTFIYLYPAANCPSVPQASNDDSAITGCACSTIDGFSYLTTTINKNTDYILRITNAGKGAFCNSSSSSSFNLYVSPTNTTAIACNSSSVTDSSIPSTGGNTCTLAALHKIEALSVNPVYKVISFDATPSSNYACYFQINIP